MRTPFDGNLNTRDISGAIPGSKRLGAFHSLSRKDFIDPNDIRDIEGAKPDTIQRGVKTVRVTDPLNPKYQLPGATEIQNHENNAFGEGSSMAPKAFAEKKKLEAKKEALQPKSIKDVVPTI